MSPYDPLLRRTTNKRLQQGVRYYVQHGTLDLVSTTLRVVLRQSHGSGVDRYLEAKSFYRDELLELVQDDRVWYYDSPETVDREEPLHFGTLSSTFRDAARPLHRDQPFVCELDDVTLVGPTANPKTSDGRYVRDADSLSRGQLLTSVIAERLTTPFRYGRRPAERVDTGVVFTNLWADNHFHWQLDFLPRLRGVEEYRRRRGRDPTLVLGSDPPDWQREYLNLLGYGSEDVHEYNGERLEVDTLVVPYGTRFKRDQIEWVRDRLLDRVSTGSREFPSKIYVSRDDALCRRVLNEDELMGALYDHGFVRVELSRMSIPAQIQLFAGADLVVGPHGAGFANLMYADDVSVLELFGAKESLTTFTLARVLDHEYACLRCENSGEDLVADVAEVEEMVETLNRRRSVTQ